MSNFDINNFDKNKNYSISASAGTGKTTSIEKIVSKLVLGEKQDINRLLIVTYTEKAAGELKSKIRNILNGVDVDNAPIGTIHSFCKKVIDRYSFAAHLPNSLDMADNSLLDDCIERFIRDDEEVFELINKCAIFCEEFNIGKLKAFLKNCINKYYITYNNEEDEEIISYDKFEETHAYYILLAMVNSGSNEELFQDYKTVYPSGLPTVIVQKFEEINGYYRIFKDSSNQRYQDFAETIVSGVLLENLGAKKYYTDDFKKDKQAKTAMDYFHTLKKELSPYRKNENIWYQLIITKNNLIKLYTMFQKEKRDIKAQTFNDMLRDIRENVLKESSKVLEQIRKDYDCAIIDEFQDTNQIQWDVFKKVFLEDKSKRIIVVGDKKQSIYAFQGADVYVYEKAVSEITNGLQSEILDTNYRSTDEMVNAYNDLFEDPCFIGKGYDKVKPCGQRKILSKKGAVKPIWVCTDSSGNGPIKEKPYAVQVAKLIIELCSSDENGKPLYETQLEPGRNPQRISLNDITILYKSRSEAEAIQKQLTKAGIPFIKYKDDSLFKGKEAFSWILMLEAINAPDYAGANRSVLKKTLMTDFFGKAIEELVDKKYDTDDFDEIKLFRSWRTSAKKRNWNELFDNIIIDTKLEERLNTPSDIQKITQFIQIADYCVDYLAKTPFLYDLIKHLKGLSTGSDDAEGDEGNIVRLGTDFNCVKLMTIHASKGLTCPIIISTALLRNRNNNIVGQVYSKHTSSGKVITFTRDDEVEKEELDEVKRLMYVAYTRQRYLLIVPNYKGVDLFEEMPTILGSRMGNSSFEVIQVSEDIKIENKDRIKVKEILNSYGSTSSAIDTKTIKENCDSVNENSKKYNAYKHSYATLTHPSKSKAQCAFDEGQLFLEETIEEVDTSRFDTKGKPIEGNYDQNKSPIALHKDFPSGASLGTALHEIFENLDYCSSVDVSVIYRSYSNNGFHFDDKEIINNTSDMVENVLSADLPFIKGNEKQQGTFKLNSISKEKRKNEMEFNFNIEDNEYLKNFMNGFVDLIFQNEHGQYCVLDWKSDKINPVLTDYNKLESLKNHVDKNYSIQRVLYSYCLIKWLKNFYNGMSFQDIFDNYFGGIYYVFLRGCNKDTSNGIYAHTWNSWDDLESAFESIVNDKVFKK